MKNLYKYGMLAVAALAFASCNKEVDTKDVTGTHVVTVRVSKDFDTRTAIVEGNDQATYEWSDGDVNYFHIYENGQEAVSKTMTVDEDGLATFTVSFNNTTATSFEYTARFFKEESNSHNPLIVANQKPTLTSYDPTADVLIAKPEPKDEPATELQFALRRVATINKMLLKGLESGEKINSVELTSTDKSFSAYWIADGEDKDGNFVPEHYSGNAKKLTLDYSELENATVGSDGTFAVFFVSAPVEDATFSVKVTSDRNVYERTLTSKLTLAVGQVKRFGIQLGDYGTPISTGTEYVLVESMDDLYSGATYLVVSNDCALGAQKYDSNNNLTNRKAVGVTVSDDVITIDNTVDAYPVVIEDVAGGYSMKVSGGYLYTDETGANRLKERSDVGTDNYAVWTISINDGVANISNVGNTSRGQMRFNPNNGNPMFACYATTGNTGTPDLALYVDVTTCVELEEAGLAYSVESPIEVVWNNRDSFEKPTLTNPHSLTVTYSSSDPAVVTVDENTGDISFVGNGTTTITASSAKTDTYKAGVATYQITVTGAPAEKGSKDNPYTPSEARDAAIALEGEASVNDVYVKGIVSEVTTAYSSSFKNVTFNLSDDGLTTSDQFVAFREKSSYSSTVAAGDAVIVKGKIVYFNSTTPEFQANNAIQTLLAKPVISGDENFTGTTSVTISATDGSAVYYTTDGSNPDTNSSVYSAAISISATTTIKAIAVKDGLITGVSSKAFNKVPTYAVTFGAPSNGTITVKHGETTLVSGDEIAAGETITITATPSSGYVLASLVYNDGSNHDIKSTKSFTMPASAVSITATFEESHGGTYSMTPDQSTTGSTATSYITTLTEFTHDGVSWKMNQWNPKTLQIKTNESSAASEFRFYNTSAFSGRIKKVVITFSALTVSDASKLMFLGGTSEVTATTGGTAGTWEEATKTLTWTPGASDNFTYFAFYQNGKAAKGTNKLAESDAIVVEYE